MDFTISPEPFPARTKTATANINGVRTDVMSVSFADKIVITVSQGGRLAHWLHVPLDVSIPEVPPTLFSEPADDDLPSSDLLPISSLTATTVLGGRAPESDTFGQLLATQVATAVKTKRSDETRVLVFGLGLEKPTSDRAAFMDLVGLTLQVL